MQPIGQTQLSGGGLSKFDKALEDCHSSVSQIMNTLNVVQGRLYMPRPSPISEGNTKDAMIGSVEGNLNQLAQRLRELESIANNILQG